MKLYNYLSRKSEDFNPKGNTVGLYTCGPTVYDFVHIGNWRTFVFEDILKRVLNFNEFKVKHVMNLTDIDDKVIKGARGKGVGIGEFTQKYAEAFFSDLERLNLIKANKYPRATEEIKPMIEHIKKLMDKGIAYGKDGSIYFDISKFKDYGKLSGTNVEGIKAGARVDVDEYEKDNPQDFALWKAEDQQALARGEAFQSPWGAGRPGWHIECSVMSMKYLGDAFDIHAGGVDLLFPHHENEIAQSETLTGKKFVNVWLEGEHLLIEGEKMAKRLGNVFTLSDLEKKGFEPLALRYLFLTAHYRSKLNFTWKSLEAAQNALNNLRNDVANWDVPEIGCFEYEGDFLKAVNNDLDIPGAVSVMHRMIKSNYLTSAKHQSLLFMDEVLGLGIKDIERARLPKGAKELIEKREKKRRERKFKESDAIRDKLIKMGVELEDTKDGSEWRVKKGLRTKDMHKGQVLYQ